MSLADSLVSGGGSSDSGGDGGGGSIDYTKGWDTADNFRANYCSKTPIFVEQNFFDDRSKEMGNSQGGLMYGGRSELYDSTTKEMNDKFVKELMKQINNGNKVDSTSFTKDTGCITNISLNKDSTGTMSQMCNPKCNFKFTGATKNLNALTNNMFILYFIIFAYSIIKYKLKIHHETCITYRY